MINEKLLHKFIINDNFIGRYGDLVTEVVVPYQEKILNDEIPGVEKSHAIENFRAAARIVEGGSCDTEFYGMVFQDSDVAKWLEAAAYSLIRHPDSNLLKRCDHVIDLLGRAQREDGYLNTFFTVKEPGKEWTNLCEAHELYCAGHMMEAAVAYYEATGKNKLLGIMCRMADCIYRHFIEEKAPGYPGHPEIELALMRLYYAVKDDRYKELSEHFINVRGVDADFFKNEGANRGWTVWGNGGDPLYAQNHAPVRNQDKAVGHAVRGVYLYSGMADVAFESKDESLTEACRTLWNDIVHCRMYITGAIGSAYEGEAFTKDYHLPNDTVYGETCAAIGLIFFAKRMLFLEKKSEYADVMEKALYNCVLAGMQQDGKRFFYVNPLEVIPGISGEAVTHRHSLPQRPEWFACACCPPNVARLINSIGMYAWDVEENTVFSHLYIGGTLNVTDEAGGCIEVRTDYPVSGKVEYIFHPSDREMKMTLAVRIPYWSSNTVIRQNDSEIKYLIKDGYAYVEGCFTEGDVVELTMDMDIRMVYASPKVSADSGRACIMRGPLVYCAEGVDNEGKILDLSIKSDGEKYCSDKADFYGNYIIYADGFRTKEQGNGNFGGLYSFEKPVKQPCKIKFVPYYTWGNRGINEMRVWMPFE